MPEGPSAQQSAWTLRIRPTSRHSAQAFARNHSFHIGRPVSFEPKDALPSAIELALGALGSDILQLFEKRAREERVEIDDAELILTCALENPLAHLNVRGEIGTPRVLELHGVLYLSTDASLSLLERLLDESMRLSPLCETLKRASDLRIRISNVR